MSEKRCYTVQELQEILGVSRPTIYNLLKKKKTGRFLHMKEMFLLSITIFVRSLVMQSCQKSIPDSSKDIIRVF